jgi:hypothetical protein
MHNLVWVGWKGGVNRERENEIGPDKSINKNISLICEIKRKP